MEKRTRIILLLLFFFSLITLKAQKDTSDMRIDIGWTRDKDINLWPFLKYKKDTLAGIVKTDVLFSIYRFERERNINEKYSHFYPLWRRQSNMNESDFRLFSLYYPSLLRFSNDKTQGIKSFDFLEFAPGVSFIGLSKSADGFYIDNNLFFLLWYNKNKTKNSSYLVFFPLYWQFSNPESSSGTVFPLWSSGSYNSGLSKYTAITPLYWHFKNGETKSNLLFPLMWSYRDNYRKRFALLPLYYRQKDQKSNVSVLFPLTGKYQTNGNDTLLRAITPLFWHYKRDQKQSNILFPIYWSFKDKDSINPWHSDILLPFWLSYTDKTHKNRVLFPIIWSNKNPKYRLFTFFPLYSHRQSTNGEKATTMVSLLYWQTKDENEKANVLFPLWFSFTNEYHRTRVLLPMVYSFRSENYQSLTVLPLFSYGSDSTKWRSHFAITPLFWHFKENRNIVNTLFPIFWDIRSRSENYPKHRTVLFPVVFRYRDNEYSRFTIFPVLYRFKNPVYQSFTLLPFFSTGKSSDSTRRHFSFATLYWQFKRTDDTVRFLFPLWWSRNRIKYGDERRYNVFFPFCWSFTNPEKQNRVIFPLIWSLKDNYYQSFTFIPFFSSGRSSNDYQSHLGITPLFWQFKNGYASSTTVFPIIWHSENTGQEAYNQTIIAPVWYSYKDSVRTRKLFFPLYWSFKNRDYQSFTFFPLFSSGHSANNEVKHTVVTPLFWRFKNEESSKTLFFPLFDSKSYSNGDQNFGILYFLFRYKNVEGQKRADLLWPLFQIKSGQDLKYFRLAPVVWYKKTPEYRFFSIQPLYYHRKTNEFNDYHLLWQLFTYKNTFDEKKSWNLIWKTLYYEKYEPGGHEFRFLYLLFADVKKNGKVEKSFFPIYYFSKEENGNRSLSLFLYFYNSFRRQLPNSVEFYKEERIFWFIRLRSNYKRLKSEGKL